MNEKFLYKCYICGRDFDNNHKITGHLRNTHGIYKNSHPDYYINYILNGERIRGNGLCYNCGKYTKFITISSGFSKYCSLECSCNYRLEYENPMDKYESRNKLSKTLKGREFSKETKEKMSKNNGMRNEEQRERMRRNNPMKRPELRKFMSENNPMKREKFRKIMRDYLSAYIRSFISCPSKPQVTLFNIINKEYKNSELEYPLKLLNKFKSIDIAIINENIDIEYDDSYWHNDVDDINRDRTIFLESGWKVLRFKNYIPKIYEVKKYIYILKNSNMFSIWIYSDKVSYYIGD